MSSKSMPKASFESSEETFPEAPPALNKKNWLKAVGILLLLVMLGLAVKSCLQARQADSPVITENKPDMTTPDEMPVQSGPRLEAAMPPKSVGDNDESMKAASPAGQAAPPLAGPVESRADLSQLTDQIRRLEGQVVKLGNKVADENTNLVQVLAGLQQQQDRLSSHLKQIEETLKTLQQQAGGKSRRHVKRTARPPRVKVVAIDRWGNQWQAVIEDNGLHILRPGSKLRGWTVREINPEGVTLVFNRRKAVLR
ncbi:MAG TPA: hypothetical protein ENJ91_10775 [Rhodobacteraceae bacterium]|nr:hypothetical protein [Paracoccaceae bacterium]